MTRTLDRFAMVDGVRNEQNARWAVTVQRELPAKWLLEVGYVGSRGFDLTMEQNENTLPRRYLSTAPARDQTTINFLTANVANPFAGLLPGEGLNGSTTQRQQLLRPYPQLQDIQTWRYDGSSRYHALQSRIERRFSSMMARDSQGRTRREEEIALVGPLAVDGPSPRLVTILDGVAGFSYTLDERQRIAYRNPIAAAKLQSHAYTYSADQKEGTRVWVTEPRDHAGWVAAESAKIAAVGIAGQKLVAGDKAASKIYLAVISTRSDSALTFGCGVRLSTAVTAYT